MSTSAPPAPLTEYVYLGVRSAVTLKGQSYALNPNSRVKLPACRYVEGLLAQQRLELASAADAKALKLEPTPTVDTKPDTSPRKGGKNDPAPSGNPIEPTAGKD